MAEVVTLRAAVAELVRDGDTVALEGFTHLIPVAAGHEIIRQSRRRLRLVRLTPDIVYDQLIGAGCARAVAFSWGGNPGVGSLRRFRDAVENGWPQPLQLEEYSHAQLTNAFIAGASRMPYAALREHPIHPSDHLTEVVCPFTGEVLVAVRAMNPDVTIIHAQQADRAGNVMLWGISGVQREAVLAAERVIVTVEEIVDQFWPRTNGVVLPTWTIDAIAVVPGGTHPSYAHDYSERDNDFYRGWEDVSQDRERFASWIERHVMGTEDWADYRRSLIRSPASSLDGSPS
ncbi:MAG: CoA transferase subunit A [Actinobacteria bacterium]|nr:CoA transferase subunit A [Actinomycetota bacterium]